MGRSVTDVGCVEHAPTTKTELKKHASAIHCSNSLSLLQRKISNALLYHAYKELMQKEEHEITVKQLCYLIGYQGHNHSAIREALKGLISTVIEWNVVSDATGTENWTASSMLASVSLEGPMCYYAYSPRMKQLLYSPSMFGKIDLVIQSRFRSSYGLALYENCIRYRGLPHTKWFEMDIFKKLMGVPEGMYDVFRDFKRRVLDKAIAEVNTYSDLIIASDVIREGRKVVKVRFSLKERAKKTRLGGKAKGMTDTLRSRLKQLFSLSATQITMLETSYEEAFIQEKMDLVLASTPYQTGKIKNISGYLLSALKNNYQLPVTTTPSVVNLEDEKAARSHALQLKHVEAIRQRYQEHRHHEIEAALARLSPTAKQDFMQRFKDSAKREIQTVLRLQRGKYTADTVYEAPAVKASLRQFALRELDFMTLTSLEEFVLQQTEDERLAWQQLKSYDPDHALLHFSE